MSLCIVIGNGPSLNNVDLNLVKGHSSIAFNHSYIAWDSLGISPCFYACFDPVALEDARDDIARLIIQRKDIKFLLSSHAARLGIKSADNIDMHDIIDSPSVVCANNTICDLGSVAATSIPLLARKGFKRFILLGIDARYSSAVGEEKEGFVVLSEDLDHFHPDYGVGKRRIKIPDLSQMLNGWKKLSLAQELLSIEVLNCSPGSALDCFETLELEKALKRFYEGGLCR